MFSGNPRPDALGWLEGHGLHQRSLIAGTDPGGQALDSSELGPEQQLGHIGMEHLASVFEERRQHLMDIKGPLREGRGPL